MCLLNWSSLASLDIGALTCGLWNCWHLSSYYRGRKLVYLEIDEECIRIYSRFIYKR